MTGKKGTAVAKQKKTNDAWTDVSAVHYFLSLATAGSPATTV